MVTVRKSLRSGCGAPSRATATPARLGQGRLTAAQKQIWFSCDGRRDCDVKLRASGHPEFDAWRWHDYWVPLESVIDFKREVYRQALIELHRYLQADRRSRPRRLEPAHSQPDGNSAHGA